MLSGYAFGQALRGMRLAKGLSQERLAAHAGVSTGYISRLEGGHHRRPGYRILAALGRALGYAGADELMAALERDPSPGEQLQRELQSLPLAARDEALAAAVAVLRSFHTDHPRGRAVLETVAA